MGLSHSKTHGQVTKVAPMPTKEGAPSPPGCVSVFGFQSPSTERSSSSFASLTERNPLSERHLPPLRENWFARYPSVPGPFSLDLKTEEGEPSIIKQHPPRRPQKLEPLILSKDVPSDKFLRQRSGAAAYTPKELEKRGPAVLHPTGRRRQHLHKMKILEMRQEAEQKRQLRQEATLGRPNKRGFKVRQKLSRVPQNDSSDEDDLFAMEHDGHLGDPWAGQLLKGHRFPETHRGPISKVESWLLNQQARKESFWDASSTDSDSWKESDEGKVSRKPALVRTKTERIQFFDEFFDQEYPSTATRTRPSWW
ncbi:uncharacterized protein CCDC198 [Eublepharis macularius]|uniref:Uncharacterized protein CCDC198 n=1 Tax=Eublepharis macularius TaxID=481883 RepID=A0AA97IZ08_EUBMA|nr:uncharacterized protein CCDC198 [Eublepharis macularius]